MKSAVTLLAIALIIASLVRASTSANYSIAASIMDRGGQRTSSASYIQTSSAETLSGRATGPSGASVESGYPAQLAALDDPALVVVAAVSRKTHGNRGEFDISLASPGIECRAPGPGGSHEVVVTFATPVSVTDVSVMSIDGLASATVSANGPIVIISLTSVANAQTIGITLLDVSNGSTTENVFIPVGVLLGDTTGNGSVSSSDIGLTKSQSGQLAGPGNFKTDVNVNGAVNASDVGLVKSRSGTSLP